MGGEGSKPEPPADKRAKRSENETLTSAIQEFLDERRSDELSLEMALGDILKSGRYSDINIHLRGRDYKAHKLILSARSPVLATMVNDKSEIDIQDVEPEVFDVYLRFLYTDQVDTLEPFALKLIRLAYQTKVDKLQVMCEQYLKKNITLENCLDIFVVCTDLTLEGLKEKTLEFIVDKKKELKTSASWKHFLDSHQNLALELLNKIVDH